MHSLRCGDLRFSSFSPQDNCTNYCEHASHHRFPLTSLTALKGTAKQFSGLMTQALAWDADSWVLILFPVDVLFSQSGTTSAVERDTESPHN